MADNPWANEEEKAAFLDSIENEIETGSFYSTKEKPIPEVREPMKQSIADEAERSVMLEQYSGQAYEKLTNPEDDSLADYIANAAYEEGVGALETATTILSGLGLTVAGGVVAGVEAAGRALFTDDTKLQILDKANQTLQKIQQNGYKPKTQEGVRNVTKVAEVGMWIEEHTSKAAGDAMFDATGNAEGAMAAYMGTELALNLLGISHVKTAAKGIAKAAASPVSLSTAVSVGTYKALVNGLWPNRAAMVKQVDDAAVDLVDRAIRDGDTATLRANIKEAAQLQDEIAGLKFSPGEASGNIELTGIESAFAGKTGGSLAAADATRQSNITAIKEYASKMLGGAETAEAKIMMKAKGDLKATIRAYDAKLAKLAEEEDALRASIQAKGMSDTSGYNMRKLYNEGYLAAKAKAEVEYSKIGHATIPAERIFERIKQIKSDSSNFYKGTPSSITKLMDENKAYFDPMLSKAGKGKEPVSLKFDNLRGHLRNLREDWANAKAMGNNNDARLINDLIKEIEGDGGVMDNLQFANFTPRQQKEAMKQYFHAKKVWKEEVVERYETAGGNIFRAVGKNGPKVLDEDLAAALFKTDSQKGNLQMMKDFKKIFKGHSENPLAWAQLRNEIYKKYSSKAIDNKGNFNPNGAKAFLRQHEETLRLVPDIRNDLLDSSTAMEKLGEINAATTAAREAYATSTFAINARTADPVAAVKAAISDIATARRLRASAKASSAGKEGLSALVGREIIKNITDINGVISGNKMLAYLETNKKTLKVLMEPQHVRALENVAKAMKALDRVNLPKTAYRKGESSMDVLKELTGTSSTSLLASARSVRHGRDSTFNLTVRTIAGWGFHMRKQQVAMMESAAFKNVTVAKFMERLAQVDDVSKIPSAEMAVYTNQLVGLGIVTPVLISRETEKSNQREQRTKDQGAL